MAGLGLAVLSIIIIFLRESAGQVGHDFLMSTAEMAERMRPTV